MGKSDKKLNWKEFRFLSRKDIKKPNGFLKHMFDELKIDWYRNFDFLISSILSPKLKCYEFDFGQNYTYLGNVIEAAFCIYAKYYPDKSLKELHKKQLHKFIISTAFYDPCLDKDEEAEVAKYYCRDYLNDFFTYKTLREWYVEMEQLLLLAFDPAAKDSIIDDMEKHLISKQFLINLPKTLHIVHKHKLFKQLP